MEINPYKYYGLGVIALIGLVWGMYVLLFSKLGVSPAYDAVYGKMFVYVFIGAVLFYVVDWTKLDGENSLFQTMFFLAEEDDTRPLSFSWYVPVLAAVFVGVAVFALVASSGFSLYGVPNAASSGLAYSSAELSQASAKNHFLSADIPGILEQFLIFAIITFASSLFAAVTSLFLGEDPMENRKVLWFWRTAFCFIAAVYFAYAHKQFAGDQAMSLWAVVFQFGVSMLDQAGGVFVSWIPHALHNHAVLFTKTLSIAPLGAFFAVILYPRRESIRQWLSRWKHDFV